MTSETDQPMDVALENEEAPPVARSRAVRWALTMAGMWVVISGVAMVVVLPFQQTQAPSAPAHGTGTKAAPGGGGLFYHAMNSMSYEKESDDRIRIDASVDAGGNSIRFVLDPGSRETVLSPEDAVIAGIDVDKLKFLERTQVDGQEIAVAPATIRYLTLRQLTLFNVQAVVGQRALASGSVLGLDFLKRFDRYELGDGKITLHW